jgi:hypothetical protein
MPAADIVRTAISPPWEQIGQKEILAWFFPKNMPGKQSGAGPLFPGCEFFQ